MKAVIIAGGEGTRLRPVTYEIPKPLIPVQKKPVIEYLLDNFVAYGCERIFIVIRKDDVIPFSNFAQLYMLKNKGKIKDPKQLAVVIETEPKGTFGGLLLASQHLDLQDGECFFATNADELKDIDLDALVKAHNPENEATIALTTVTDPENYGNVEVDDKKKITGFFEKGADGKLTCFVSTGTYILRKDIFKYNNGQPFMMIEKDVFPKVAENYRLGFYNHPGQFYPTDTLQKWDDAIQNYKHTPAKY